MLSTVGQPTKNVNKVEKITKKVGNYDFLVKQPFIFCRFCLIPAIILKFDDQKEAVDRKKVAWKLEQIDLGGREGLPVMSQLFH